MFGVKKISYIFCMLFLVGLMTACGKKDKQNIISEALNIDVEKGKIISEYNTHDGHMEMVLLVLYSNLIMIQF